MKKLLSIFLIGQLLLLSYIYNKSIFDIYELNNLGDPSLDSYIVEYNSGNELNLLYKEINSQCLSNKECRLQLIKTPISKQNQFIYDIYHSEVEKINKPKSISADTIFIYHQLKKEDFIDSNGIFYTNLSSDTLNNLSKNIGIVIKPYHNAIKYNQIIKYNALNFVILLILTQLVLFIYTFIRIKINAIKKMLGYSKFKMIKASLKEFLLIEGIALFITIAIHFMYFVSQDNLVPRYFYLLLAFLAAIILINTCLLLFTQISLKFIDINLMIKNKVYSNRLNSLLYGIKILLILAITVSISYFISNHSDYQEKSNQLKKYRHLDSYFTSNGFNSDEFDKALKDTKLLSTYGDSVKRIYNYYDAKEKLYVASANILELLDPEYLERNGLKKEDLYHSIKDNFIVVNNQYINEFMPLKKESGIELGKSDKNKPTILVPSKYKSREAEIKKIYMEKYNELLNYNEFYRASTSKQSIDQLDIRYINNNLEYEIFGKNAKNKDGSIIKLRDSILIIDQGNFGSLYYYDLLNGGDLYFKLQQRDEFSQTLAKYELDKLINVGTLLTPYMDEVHFVEFVMYNSLIFTILFLFTLIFLIYISNYVDVISNIRRYAVQYIYGFDLFKTFKTHIIVYVLLLCAMILNVFMEFNILFYLIMLMVDVIILLLVYKKIVKNDIHKIIKGG